MSNNTTIYRDTVDENEFSPRFVNGNSKTGRVLTFNTLPTDGIIYNADGRAVVNVKGTCSGVCDGCGHTGICYAIKFAKMRRNVAVSWAKNTVAIRHFARRFESWAIGEIVREADKAEKRGDRRLYVRIHSAGEFMTGEEMGCYGEYGELWLWARIADACASLCEIPVYFYSYTKRAELLDRMHHWMQDGEKWPSNYVVNVSAGFGIRPGDARKIGPVFLYDDGTNEDVSDPYRIWL